MRFHSSHTYPKAAGNLLVAQALGDLDEDLALAIGQQRRRRAFAAAADELAQGHAGDIGTKEGFAALDSLDGADKVVGCGFLEPVAARAGLEVVRDILRRAGQG